MKWVALRADSLKMMPLLAMMPTRCPQTRAKPHTIDSPHSGLKGEKREPSTMRAMISVASNGMRSSALMMPWISAGSWAGGSGSAQSIHAWRASMGRWPVVLQISRSLP